MPDPGIRDRDHASDHDERGDDDVHGGGDRPSLKLSKACGLFSGFFRSELLNRLFPVIIHQMEERASHKRLEKVEVRGHVIEDGPTRHEAEYRSNCNIQQNEERDARGVAVVKIFPDERLEHQAVQKHALTEFLGMQMRAAVDLVDADQSRAIGHRVEK